MITAAPAATGRSVHLAGEHDDRSIDGYELFSARRALELLKRRLGRDALLDLLRPDIAAGDAFLRDHLRRSGGREATGVTTLTARGISAPQFLGWLSRAFAREDVMVAGHPEHYAIHAAPGANVTIVETLGEHVCSFSMKEWDDSLVPKQELPLAEGAPAGRRSHILLADGTVVGSIANAFEDIPATADGGGVAGFTARLAVTLPVTCEPEVVGQHLEHFAVEFRSWILAAAAELEDPA